MEQLSDWLERKTDQRTGWMVLRLISCRLHWLTEQNTWSSHAAIAAIWTEREEAYREARRNGGLLYLYERNGGTRAYTATHTE